jgi:hypothetical protein
VRLGRCDLDVLNAKWCACFPGHGGLTGDSLERGHGC